MIRKLIINSILEESNYYAQIRKLKKISNYLKTHRIMQTLSSKIKILHRNSTLNSSKRILKNLLTKMIYAIRNFRNLS